MDNQETTGESKDLLDGAIEFLSATGANESTIRSKAIGLQLTLMGRAEREAKRIQRYIETAERLEQNLYNMETIEAELANGTLNKTEINKHLAVLSKNISDASKFITEVIQKTDVDQITNHLDFILTQETEAVGKNETLSPELTSAAKLLLSTMTSAPVEEEEEEKPKIINGPSIPNPELTQEELDQSSEDIFDALLSINIDDDDEEEVAQEDLPHTVDPTLEENPFDSETTVEPENKPEPTLNVAPTSPNPTASFFDALDD